MTGPRVITPESINRRRVRKLRNQLTVLAAFVSQKMDTDSEIRPTLGYIENRLDEIQGIVREMEA